ncbi:MAG: M17 family metallopeptidase [Gammaproteobacteria bacterium]
MPELLPNARKLRVIQTPGTVRRTALDQVDQLIIVVPRAVPAGLWKKLPDGSRLRTLARRMGSKAMLHSRLPNPAATGVIVGRMPKGSPPAKSPGAFELLGFAGKLVGEALQDKPRSIGLMMAGVDPSLAEATVRATTLAALAHAFRLPTFAKPSARASGPKTVRILGLDSRIDLGRELAEADAVNLARWLTALPANKLDAGSYRGTLKALAKDHGWQMEFFDERKLKTLGAGAFLAVAQGNATPDAGIVRLRYRPDRSKQQPALALIGKGVMFDTGGNDVKSFKSMLDMHEDMGGSAVAVATLSALTHVGYPEAVDCWLGITENRIGARAYKSRDVVTATNGVTIEVIHTDAEGRMVLADTLALAGKEEPRLIVDYATLTGACFHALTSRYSGVFTNRDRLNQLLVDTGTTCGERVWPFPMDDDYDDDIKSKVADVLQCSIGGEGDHILAARFLQRFVPKATHWIHMDLSAVTNKKGLAQVPAGVTGFGVRYTLHLLLDRASEFQRILGNAPAA